MTPNNVLKEPLYYHRIYAIRGRIALPAELVRNRSAAEGSNRSANHENNTDHGIETRRAAVWNAS